MSVLGALGGAASLANSVSKAVTTQADKTKLTQQDFLKILTQQLTAQDPTKPYDSASMLDQMANLTSLSTSENLQKSINTLTSSLGNVQLFQASQLVGKQVLAKSNVSPLNSDGMKGTLMLDKDATNITVTIRDTAGKIVKTMNLGSAKAGNLDFKWNGVGDNGQTLPLGTYQISATGKIGKEYAALPTAGAFKINSIAAGQGQNLQLNLETMGKVNFTDVVAIL